ncbi:hypothetical protein GQ600_2093 [Phytophthora cactorum]|nr:hypothetical protein GQ600_2093 [Phytophthora cactorum]
MTEKKITYEVDAEHSRGATEETSQRLVSILETFARGSTTVEELEYTAELLIATAEEEARIKTVLEETEFLDAAQLCSFAEQLLMRRRLRKERLETQFAIGKSCLVVLDEDEAWHPARITKHIGENEDSDDESVVDDRPIEVEKQIAREDEVVLDEDVAGREDAEDMTGLCEMCERPMNLTAHHVIPRVTHANICAKGQQDASARVQTLDKIMQHPEIIAWVAYARKQKARIKPRQKSKWPVGK